MKVVMILFVSTSLPSVCLTWSILSSNAVSCFIKSHPARSASLRHSLVDAPHCSHLKKSQSWATSEIRRQRSCTYLRAKNEDSNYEKIEYYDENEEVPSDTSRDSLGRVEELGMFPLGIVLNPGRK